MTVFLAFMQFIFNGFHSQVSFSSATTDGASKKGRFCALQMLWREQNEWSDGDCGVVVAHGSDSLNRLRLCRSDSLSRHSYLLDGLRPVRRKGHIGTKHKVIRSQVKLCSLFMTCATSWWKRIKKRREGAKKNLMKSSEKAHFPAVSEACQARITQRW